MIRYYSTNCSTIDRSSAIIILEKNSIYHISTEYVISDGSFTLILSQIKLLSWRYVEILLKGADYPNRFPEISCVVRFIRQILFVYE